MLQQPQNFEMLLQFLYEKGYEIRYGKHNALKKKDDKRFVRLDSLGAGYT